MPSIPPKPPTVIPEPVTQPAIQKWKLQRRNRLRTATLRPGQTLVLPAGDDGPSKVVVGMGPSDEVGPDQLRRAGAKEVHMRISAPPIRHPCHYGIDMSTREEMIAHNRTEAEVAAELGADSLAYLSLEGLQMAIRVDRAAAARYGVTMNVIDNTLYPAGEDSPCATVRVTLSRERAVEAYNLANVKLNRIKHDLNDNTHALTVARDALAVAFEHELLQVRG